jgi:hypothetical protein
VRRILFDEAQIELGLLPLEAPAAPPAGTVAYVKDAGTWKTATVHVKDGGTWKVATAYVRDGGTWN